MCTIFVGFRSAGSIDYADVAGSECIVAVGNPQYELAGAGNAGSL